MLKKSSDLFIVVSVLTRTGFNHAAHDERACKPDSVEDNHLSCRIIAAAILAATPSANWWRARPCAQVRI